MRNLFELGQCIDGIWLYSDTDSCYGTEWNEKKVDEYNAERVKRLKLNGYDPVTVRDRQFSPGIAELDGIYSEFKTLGAKRYACRDAETGKLKITVSGVPKKGCECLNDDINNFKRGMIFPGTVTGKKMHTYIFTDGITIDENGNEIGDSIDLTPCNYLLDQITIADFDELFTEEITIQIYDEEDFSHE